MISVVIPTYNNEKTLLKCLQALARQDISLDLMEVVVVADGCREQTAEVLSSWADSSPFPFVWKQQSNQGPGPARNNGIRTAAHDLILIINDDLIAEPQLVGRHAQWHRLHPAPECALLGYVQELPQETDGFSVVRLEHAFESACQKSALSWDNFWTTNISLKRGFLESTGEWFSSSFPHPVHEDVELGYRLGRKGLTLHMDEQARGLHDHPMDYAQFARRAYQSGLCLTEFFRLHPELRAFLEGKGLVLPNTSRGLIAATLINNWTIGTIEKTAKALRRSGRVAPSDFLFSRLFGYHQRRGVAAGLRRGAS
ncbi:MAG: glycosyltransferase [Elusimicrobiota bacterium]